MGLNKSRFEEIIDEIKKEKGVKEDIDLEADDMKELTARFKTFYAQELGSEFPQDPQYAAVRGDSGSIPFME